MKRFDIVIVGAGASGLMASCCYKDRNLALIDNNLHIAQKIKISGGGKCNVTNEKVCTENYLGDSEFIKSVLDSFSQHSLLTFLKDRGCQPLIRKDGQYFCKHSSDEIIDVFKREIEDVKVFLNQSVVKVEKKDSFYIQTDKEQFEAKKLIIASGGLSYPKIGASCIAYDIASSFGHTINKTTPALVGFTVQRDQFWMRELSGISTTVEIGVGDKTFNGELLFTHKGVSGPAILNTSLYWKKGDVEIDFLPKKSLHEYIKNSKKLISSALPLPKRFIKRFLKSIDLDDISVDKLNNLQIEKLSKLKRYSFAPAGNFGYQKAEVTRGGISTDEINPNNMMSKIVKDLYFIGECLDVTGELGGYNFQWAFSSAKKLTL